jgi:hypothetical protein
VNTIENALSLAEKGMGLHKKYLSDRWYENKRNARKVEKLLKYELRRCKMEAMNEIAEDLVDAARLHNNKTLYWHVEN